MLNNTINRTYWMVWQKMAAAMDVAHEEDGVTATEWIGMVGAILLLLTMVGAGLEAGGESVGSTIIGQLTNLVTQLFVF